MLCSSTEQRRCRPELCNQAACGLAAPAHHVPAGCVATIADAHMTKCPPCIAKNLNAWSPCMLYHASVPIAACPVAVSCHRDVLKPQAVHLFVSTTPSLCITGLRCLGFV